MSHPNCNVLLIEDNPADAKLIQEALTDTRFGPFQLEWVKNLSDGLERLSKGGVEAILADLQRQFRRCEQLQPADLTLAVSHSFLAPISRVKNESMETFVEHVVAGIQDRISTIRLQRSA